MSRLSPIGATAPLVLQRKIYKTKNGYESHALGGQYFESREEAMKAEDAARNLPQRAEHIDHSDSGKRDHQRKRERDAVHNRKSRHARGKETQPNLDARKKKALGLREVEPKLKVTYESYHNAGVRGDYDTPGLALALSREQRKDGPFDEHHEQPKLMWRADTRSPKEVFRPRLSKKERRAGLKKKNLQPGFQTSAEREGITDKGKGTIIYRTGHDDITSSSGISVSPGVRSAAFFPFNSKKSDQGAHRQQTYLYGIAAPHTVNTYRAQKGAERVETGQKRWKNPARFNYDPDENNAESTSTVWPYKEHAMHRVHPDQIVAAYNVNQDRIDASNSKAGSGFSLKRVRMPRAAEKRARAHPLREQADATASLYERRYPSEPRTFMSYQGQVSFDQLPGGANSEKPSVVAHSPFPPGRNAPSESKLARRNKAKKQKAGKERRRNNGNARSGGFRGR
jgi:hypothetical protein